MVHESEGELDENLKEEIAEHLESLEKEFQHTSLILQKKLYWYKTHSLLP